MPGLNQSGIGVNETIYVKYFCLMRITDFPWENKFLLCRLLIALLTKHDDLVQVVKNIFLLLSMIFLAIHFTSHLSSMTTA